MASDRFEVVSPVGEPKSAPAASASRIKDLNGKTICEVWNGLFRADNVLAAFGELVKKRYPDAKVIPWTELPLVSPSGDIEKSLKELREAYRQKGCDAVISSTGG